MRFCTLDLSRTHKRKARHRSKIHSLPQTPPPPPLFSSVSHDVHCQSFVYMYDNGSARFARYILYGLYKKHTLVSHILSRFCIRFLSIRHTDNLGGYDLYKGSLQISTRHLHPTHYNKYTLLRTI